MTWTEPRRSARLQAAQVSLPAPKPLQKRPMSTEFDTQRPCKRFRLTKHNLHVFNKIEGGRNKKKDIATASTESKQSSTSSTNPQFATALRKNGVLDVEQSKEPTNLTQLKEILDRARDTVSPSEEDYRYYVSAVRRVPNKASMLSHTADLLMKQHHKVGYLKVYNQSFNALPTEIGFNDSLAACQPDVVEGLTRSEFGPAIDNELEESTNLYSHGDPIWFPHVAGELKGPGKDMIQAERQAAYDGACLVYGRSQACALLGQHDPDGQASIQTFTTDGTVLNTFAHYTSERRGQTVYHQYPTSSTLLLPSFDGFKRGRRVLRNLEDHAKAQSEALRDSLVFFAESRAVVDQATTVLAEPNLHTRLDETARSTEHEKHLSYETRASEAKTTARTSHRCRDEEPLTGTRVGVEQSTEAVPRLDSDEAQPEAEHPVTPPYSASFEYAKPKKRPTKKSPESEVRRSRRARHR